jgi:hypothetical protein
MTFAHQNLAIIQIQGHGARLMAKSFGLER